MMLTSTKFPYQMTEGELKREMAARLDLGEKINAWRHAAVADGWTMDATYSSESSDRAFTMTAPNGYKANGLVRLDTLPVVSLHAWDEKGLSLDDAIEFRCPQCLVAHLHTAEKESKPPICQFFSFEYARNVPSVQPTKLCQRVSCC